MARITKQDRELLTRALDTCLVKARDDLVAFARETFHVNGATFEGDWAALKKFLIDTCDRGGMLHQYETFEKSILELKMKLEEKKSGHKKGKSGKGRGKK